MSPKVAKNWTMSSEPYPKPMVEQCNSYYAQLLFEDYAGPVSELTAISQYINHCITSRSDYDVVELIRKIAITEMRHFELLGITIQLLGSSPVIGCVNNNTMDYWSSKFVYYGNDIIDRLSANATHEANAIRNYRIHQKKIDDPYIKKLLERIISDEELHLRLLMDAKDMLCTKYY